MKDERSEGNREDEKAARGKEEEQPDNVTVVNGNSVTAVGVRLMSSLEQNYRDTSEISRQKEKKLYNGERKVACDTLQAFVYECLSSVR